MPLALWCFRPVRLLVLVLAFPAFPLSAQRPDTLRVAPPHRVALEAHRSRIEQDPDTLPPVVSQADRRTVGQLGRGIVSKGSAGEDRMLQQQN